MKTIIFVGIGIGFVSGIGIGLVSGIGIGFNVNI